MKIWFSCQINAEVGGETPIADSRELLQKLDASIKKQFIEKQVMCVRNSTVSWICLGKMFSSQKTKRS
ncbi:TauD/TfdA family dioxygenase [Paenibacillus marchantiae]|uniref:TauD/TfdA family dioxygenase n=1 Tax=Paenibacillus marchantiae TaxID=3026433 RepID=UPI003B75B91C